MKRARQMRERWSGNHPAKPLYLREVIPYLTKPYLLFVFFYFYFFVSPRFFQDKTKILFCLSCYPRNCLYIYRFPPPHLFLPSAQYRNLNTKGDYSEQDPKSTSLFRRIPCESLMYQFLRKWTRQADRDLLM